MTVVSAAGGDQVTGPTIEANELRKELIRLLPLISEDRLEVILGETELDADAAGETFHDNGEYLVAVGVSALQEWGWCARVAVHEFAHVVRGRLAHEGTYPAPDVASAHPEGDPIKSALRSVMAHSLVHEAATRVEAVDNALRHLLPAFPEIWSIAAIDLRRSGGAACEEEFRAITTEIRGDEVESPFGTYAIHTLQDDGAHDPLFYFIAYFLERRAEDLGFFSQTRTAVVSLTPGAQAWSRRFGPAAG